MRLIVIQVVAGFGGKPAVSLCIYIHREQRLCPPGGQAVKMLPAAGINLRRDERDSTQGQDLRNSDA